MSDYIDRRKFEQLITERDLRTISTKTIGECLDKSLADVVEVVRCKDCKFWDSDCIWCNLWGNTQEYGNGFCSYGEKKEQENE